MNTILSSSDILTIPKDLAIVALLPHDEAIKTECLFFALDKEKKNLSLLTTNNFPDHYHGIIDIYTKKGYKINSFFTDSVGFTQALQRYDEWETAKDGAHEATQKRLQASGEEALAILRNTCEKRSSFTSEGGFLEEVLRLAYKTGSSDVHFQTEEKGVFLRIRKDGLLDSICMFSHEEFAKYLMKLKFMSGVKMNLTHQSQDGRFSILLEGTNSTSRKLDVRTSFLPSLRGESIVLRFLDSTKSIQTLEALGMRAWHTKILDEQLKKHHGLVLVTGPTGSGKTTTVYTLLHLLNTPEKKIITLEDPVEYEIPGVTQSQINEEAGYTFEEGLKGILRHDPNIIVVGEIRTLESAQLAINAAITGHLVISTVHTNSAVEAISRLLNMGIPPFMLAASLNCIIGQRLLRKAVNPMSEALPQSYTAYDHSVRQTMETILPQETLPQTSTVWRMNTQCKIADAYSGRIGAYECVNIGQEIKQAIIDGKTTLELQKIADRQGFISMKDDAWIKMLQQQTTIEEIERVI